jgi:hypothetical protein
MRVLRRVSVAFVAVLLTSTQLTVAAGAAPPPSPDVDQRVPPTASAAPASLGPDERAEKLGGGWGSSADRAVATAGDAAGFHVLVADAKDGYRWRTAASLSEPGFETDAWIGNMCVTASGERAVVVYAPRTFTNKPDLAQRGGFTAIVDLNGGPVRKLPFQTSLAYFNPGCGPTETAVLTQEGTDDLQRTRLLELDTVSGNLVRPIEVPGQLTSPVPTAHGIVAADSGAVVRVAPDGTRTVLAGAKGVPYRLAADADGGVVFAQTDDTKSSSVRRVDVPPAGRGTVTTLATGSIMDLSVRSARGGQVYVTGTKTVRATPASVVLTDTVPGAVASLGGDIAVTKVLRTNTKDPRVMPPDPTSPQPVDITAVSFVTGEEFTLTATPVSGAAQGAEPSPALPSKAAGNPNDPADGDQRTCSVPRNDPRNQAMQPKPRQVEWAVDQAVRGVLTVQRPANWKNLGMPAYTPQGLFPRAGLSGGGYIPAQVMLGITAQESNMWQAARFAVPGVTANPLIGNYFGIDYYNDTGSDDWTIRWDKADCGYGVAQITDGMRKPGMGQPSMPYDHQRAIALDFAANVAKGVQMLEQKWNETRTAGLTINGGGAQWIENWFFAVWAYNSGFYPESTAGQNSGAWGVGWLNNPANPRYPAERTPFLDNSYADAAHPQDWPYPEKVMGWAGHPIELIETPGTLVHGYRAAWWVTEEDRWNVKPPIFQFCDDSNNCDPDAEITPNDPEVIGEPAGPCAHRNGNGLYDLKCWYHEENGWKVCPQVCGNELLRFDPGYAYQEDAASYAPNCGRGGLPSNALFIDNLPSSVPSIRPNCSVAATDAGTFQFTFAANGQGNFPGKIDVHQIGTGFGGQFWMSNTHKASDRRAVGVWAFTRSVGEWGRVLVHLPVVGARTQQAGYDIDLNGDGVWDTTRYIPQEIRQNGWVSLGVYRFTGMPRIRLSNETEDGAGTDRIAWDAVAVQPLPGKPKHIVAALGDSYSSGEGASSYLTASDVNHGTAQWNACRRSRDAWPRKVVLPGDGSSLGTLSDGWGSNHELGFVACSGAKTWNVGGWGVPQSWADPAKYETGEGQFHEMSQVNSGVLDVNTTLVTLSIGGNDGNAFAGALQDCGGLGNCADDDFLPTYKGLIDTAMSNTERLLRQINGKAPNADIILMGYPEMFSRTVKCAGSWYFDMTEVQALAELAGYVATKQQALAASLRSANIPVHEASPINDFVGHGACDDPEWIHKFRVGANGEGDFHNGDKPSPFCFWDILGGACLSRESFHPNTAGTSGYATVLRRKLDQIGYVG